MKREDIAALGEQIRDRRKELGLMQKDLARMVGVRPTTICKIEYGDMYPSKELLTKIQYVLNDNLGEASEKFSTKIDISMLDTLNQQIANAIIELRHAQTIICAFKEKIENREEE